MCETGRRAPLMAIGWVRVMPRSRVFPKVARVVLASVGLCSLWRQPSALVPRRSRGFDRLSQLMGLGLVRYRQGCA